MSEEKENRLYYIICDISRITKKYFYERKYLPSDCWSMDKVVKNIIASSQKLKKEYQNIKKEK